MSVNLSPFGPKPQFEGSGGLPAVGNKLFFYVAGSVGTKQNTYTDSTGATPNTNPIILDSLGNPTNTQIWFTSGQAYKVVYAPSTDTDPPSSPIWTVDNIVGINDTTVSASEWVAGPTPTYVSGTQFTLAGDQTGTFTVSRRIRATVTAGTVYGYISASAYAALTTVTVVLDSGSLDSGLTAVNYGLLASTNPSVPQKYARTDAAQTFSLAQTFSGNVIVGSSACVISGTTGFIGVGGTEPNSPVYCESDVNSGQHIIMRNTNTGGAAQAVVYCQASGTGGDGGLNDIHMFQYSPNNSHGMIGNSEGGIYSNTAAINIMAEYGVIRFAAGSSSELAKFTSAGLFNKGGYAGLSSTATPAGNAAAQVLSIGSAGPGIYFCSGAPTVVAAKGSFCLRTDGSTTNNRLYVNTDGSTTWTAVTTAA